MLHQRSGERLRGCHALLSHSMAVHDVYLCIGGNLGDRFANLEETRLFIAFNFGDITGVSPVVESEAWGMSDSPSFLNQVVRISTELDPAALLTEIRELEEYYGRRRSADKYLDREMDVDVLSYDQLVSDDPGCLVPHPRMHLRRFVLMPLAALSPDWKHPVLQKTADQLLSACEDSSKVSVYAGT